jgi:hypothetical protein
MQDFFHCPFKLDDLRDIIYSEFLYLSSIPPSNDGTMANAALERIAFSIGGLSRAHFRDSETLEHDNGGTLP